MDNNKEYTHLNLPIETKEIAPINEMMQSVRKNADTSTKKQGDFFVNFGEINNRGVDNRIQTFDNTTPFLDVYQPLNSGEVVAKYDTFTPGIDNNEYLAQNQSGWEQTINGLEKAGANIGSVVLGNTAGFVYGLADWAKTGNFSSVYDNSFSETLDDWNTKLNYQLPNYYSKQEKEAGFFGSIGSANFWANDVMNGLSFTVGTIASEAIWAWATGGASLAVRMGRAGAKIGQATRVITGAARAGEEVAMAARVGGEVANAGKFGKALLGSEKVAEGLAGYKGLAYKALDNAVATGKMSKGLANTLAKTGEILNTTRFIGTSSGNEAGIEAFHFKKEATENFYRNFEELNGRKPTAEESAENLDKIEGAANWVFASNMAVLGFSNLAMLGNLFKLKSPISTLQKSVNQKLFGIGVKQVAGETGELVFKGIERKAWQKGAGLLYKGTSPIVREGLFEEGLQGATTKTANNWIERQYDPKYLNKVMSLSDDAWKAMGEQYGTKAGWKEIGIGGIVGILGGVGTGEFSQFSRMAEEQEKIVSKGLNAANVTMKTFVSDINAGRMMTMAKVMEAEDRAERAMTKRDVVSAKLAHNDSMIALAEMYNNPLYGAGGLAQMEKHGNNMIDTTEATDQEKQELKAGFKSFIGEYKSANNFANSIVGNQGRIYGTDFQAADVQKALTYTILQGQSSKKMMDESLSEIGILMGKDKEDVIKRNEGLQSLEGIVKKTFNSLAKEKEILEKTSENIQEKIRLEQMSVKEGRESKLPLLERELIKIEKRKLDINSELEVIAGKIATNKKLEQSFGREMKDIPMTDEFISVQDLLNVEKNLTELEDSYKMLKAVNPISAQAVKENMDNYKKAQKALLDHNSAIKLIASGKFKPQLADTNPFSGIYKKFAKGEEKADEHTSQFLTRLNEIRNSYKNSVMGVGQEKDVEKYQAELAELSKKKKEDLTEDEVKRIQFLIENIAILQKDAKSPAKIQAKIDELEKELATIEDDNDPRIEEIDTLISELEKELKGTSEQVKNDTPSRENKNKQKVEELTSRIKALEEELKNTPENVTVEQPTMAVQSDIKIDSLEDLDKLTQEQKEALKIAVREKIDLLPDNQVYFIHLTPFENDARNIIASGLRTGIAIESTTNMVGSKESLYESISAIIDGKVRHRDSANLVIIGFNRDLFNSGKINSDALFDYLVENHPDFASNFTIPSEYNVGLFTNGQLEVNEKYDKKAKQTQEQPNPRIKEIQKEINSLKREINKLNPQAEISTVEALKARIEDILKLFKTSFVGTYNVDEAVKNRPDQKDIERYRELLNQEPTQEFEELKAKLSQWRVYDSLAEDEQSVADLLDLVAQLETEVEQENTVTEPNAEDTFEELKKTATVDILELSVNTNYPVTVKRETNGSYSITHMNPSSLLQRMGATDVKIGKKEVSFEEVDNQKKQGMRVTFISGGVPMSFEIKDRGRIEIAEKDFKAIPNVKTIESLSSWTYPTLYEQDFEGNWKPISSDFSDPNITGDSNNLKDEDALELFIDVNNEYNQKLLKDKVKGEELENQVVIYIRKGGENYGTIKGLTQDNRNELLGSEASILTLRKLAAEALKEGKSGVVATTQVKYVQLGNPILTINENGRISQIAISDLGLKNIVATGFVQDGEITLNKEVKDVRKSFIKKVSEKNKGKKVPIVVIKRGAQMIAFPVQMVKTNVSKVEELYVILDDTTKTDAQKVTAINNLLIENGIAPKEFELTALEEQKIARIEARLEANKEYKTADQLADKNYKKENLKNDATIALDLENLSVSLPSQKFNIDLENLDYEDLPEPKIEKQEQIEKKAEKTDSTPKTASAKRQVNSKKTPIKKHTIEFTVEDFQVKALPKPLADKVKKQTSKNKVIDYTQEDLIALKKAGVVVVERGVAKKPRESKVADADEIANEIVEKFTPIEIDEQDIEDVIIEEMKTSEDSLDNLALKIFRSRLTPTEYILQSDDEVEKQTILADIGYIEKRIKELTPKIEVKPSTKTSEKAPVPQNGTINKASMISFEGIDFAGKAFTYYKKGNVWGYITEDRYGNEWFESFMSRAQPDIESKYQSQKEASQTEKEITCK